MYISLLQSSDSGSYECIASNKFHASISRSFYVTVQCKFSIERFYLHEKFGRRSNSIDCESISVRCGSHYSIRLSFRLDAIQL